jgi:hypothetical protein
LGQRAAFRRAGPVAALAAPPSGPFRADRAARAARAGWGSFGGLPHSVDCALDPGRKAGTKIEIAGRVRGLMADYLEQALGHQAAVDLADANWPHAGTLVQGNKSAGHERAICGPWRVVVGKPFG